MRKEYSSLNVRGNYINNQVDITKTYSGSPEPYNTHYNNRNLNNNLNNNINNNINNNLKTVNIDSYENRETMMNNYNNFVNNNFDKNNINNINYYNNINNTTRNPSMYNNNNLNMSFNYVKKNDVMNDSMDNRYKPRNSFNSCPGFDNNLSFNNLGGNNNNLGNNMNLINHFNNTNINLWLLNNNNEGPMNNCGGCMNNNNYAMKQLLLNLNPMTAPLIRNMNENNYGLNSNNMYNNFQNPNHMYNTFHQSCHNLSSFNPENTYFNTLKKSHSSKKITLANNSDNCCKNCRSEGNLSIDNSSCSSFGSVKKAAKKKRTSLFQNDCNKEKDLRDYKRFCDGLKSPMPDYICSQIGSRIMQKYLKKFPTYIRTILINNLAGSYEKLICNTYANYFCQKLYNISVLEQRLLILQNLKNIFINVSKNNCGAHVAQFIIGAANSIEEKMIIIDYVRDHELELAFDPEGTHVIQKIISCFQENERQTLTNVLCVHENLNALCQDAKGMCVVKKLIACTKDINNKYLIINGVYSHFLEIAQSPYGNYIIQYLFDEWDVSICQKLVQCCVDNSELFAMQKYSSNIIVKIMEMYSDTYLNNGTLNFVQQLKKIFFDEKKLLDLYNNKYGRLLLFKLNKLLTKEDKDTIYTNINLSEDNKKEKMDIILELFNMKI